MSTDEAMRKAMQEQALRLQKEFDNLEALRSWVKPVYDARAKRAEVHFDSPFGVCRFWWDGSFWIIDQPEVDSIYAKAGGLQKAMRQVWGEIEERLISREMQTQAARLRDEFGAMEEIVSWATPIYDREAKRPELRFDSPVGVCRTWWEKTLWKVRLPDGSETPVQPGKLREKLINVRKFLRKGVL